MYVSMHDVAFLLAIRCFIKKTRVNINRVRQKYVCNEMLASNYKTTVVMNNLVDFILSHFVRSCLYSVSSVGWLSSQ